MANRTLSLHAWLKLPDVGWRQRISTHLLAVRLMSVLPKTFPRPDSD